MASKFASKIKAYDEIFGHIPLDAEERMLYLLSKLKFREKELPVIEKFYKKLKSMKTTSYSFILYLVPEPTPRPRTSSRTHTFYVKGAKENHNLFKEIMNTIGDVPIITTPTQIEIVSYLPTPKSMNRLETFFAEIGLIKPVSIPDWDNLAKAYCDMIQKNLIINDSLIWSGSSIKRYSIKPRIEMTLTFDKAYDCKFNRDRIEKSVFYQAEDRSKFDTSLRTILHLK